MDTFIKNYWSLYMDFLHDFEALTYQDVALVYLIPLPGYIFHHSQIMQALEKKAFIKHMKRPVKTSKDIQNKFNQFTAINQGNQKKKNGKLAIHVDKLLRLPKKNIIQQFSAAEPIILSNGKSKKKKARKSTGRKKATVINTPIARKRTVNKPTNKGNTLIYYLNDYEVNVSKKIRRIQQKAKTLLSQYQNHHLYGEPSFQKWLLEQIAQVISHMEKTVHFLKKVPVSCFIVSTTHSFMNRILAIIGAKQGIPTICLQHGIISSELGYIPKIATVDAVYGQFEKDWYQKLGAKPSSLEIIGHPRFDQMYHSSRYNRRIFQSRLGLDKRRETIMIAARRNEDINRWRQFIQQLNKKKKYNIIIKNYPGSEPHLLTKELDNVYSIQGYSLYDVFHHVDLVVAYSSTVGLEAMLSGRVVFILNKNFPGMTGYYQSLSPLIQHNPSTLAEQVNRYFTDKSFRKTAEGKRRQFLSYAYPSKQLSINRLNKLVSRLTS